MPALYLHIPFCQKRCIYCDFYSTTNAELKATYVDALCRELELRHDYVQGAPLETIYLGGGTPSQLSEAELNQIFACIYKVYAVCSDAEITLEANPDDLSPDYVQMLRTLPINRLSMGVQTFSDTRLHFLNRRHTARQAIEAVKCCQDVDFANISIDLIYGLPNETSAEWQHDLRQAIDLHVQHISAYNLIYEEGTALWRMREAGKVREADEDTSLQQFGTLIDTLAAAGFRHYEISNFCQPGRHSRHNSSYWTGATYLGVGAAAHSYNGLCRQKNVPDLTRYLQGISSGEMDFEEELLNEDERYNDLILTSLRTVWGLDLQTLKTAFGEALCRYCLQNAQSYLRQGKLELLPATPEHPQGVLKLTRAGLFVSDEIMSDLMKV